MKDRTGSKTWEEVKTFDDILLPPEITIIRELQQENSSCCPYLGRVGECWHYCKAVFQERVDPIPSQDNPVYITHQDCVSLQIWCMDLHYRKCINFLAK